MIWGLLSNSRYESLRLGRINSSPGLMIRTLLSKPSALLVFNAINSGYLSINIFMDRAVYPTLRHRFPKMGIFWV